jgi:probable rRNA maturation factor
MPVLISNRQSSHRLPVRKIAKTAQDVLNASGSPDAELSLLITDDVEITRYNQQYLGRKGPTNVLAFPMTEGEFSGITPGLLGDVVISADTALREAREMGITLKERFTQLLIHGILHLLGYDHEASDRQAREMDRKAEALIKTIDPL